MRKKLLYVPSLILLLSLTTFSQEPSDLKVPVRVVHQYPNGNYALIIDGKPFTTLNPAQTQQADIDRLEAQKVSQLETTVNEQKKLIDLLQAQVAGFKKLEDLDTHLIGLAQQVDIIRVQQHQDSLARALDAKKTNDAIAAVGVAAKGTWLDRFLDKVPVKAGQVGIGLLANGRTAFFPPNTGPCAPAGMPVVTLRFGKR